MGSPFDGRERIAESRCPEPRGEGFPGTLDPDLHEPVDDFAFREAGRKVRREKDSGSDDGRFSTVVLGDDDDEVLDLPFGESSGVEGPDEVKRWKSFANVSA